MLNNGTPAKTKRNERLIKWREANPTGNISAIARMFHISRQRADQIIKRHYKQLEANHVDQPAPPASNQVGSV